MHYFSPSKAERASAETKARTFAKKLPFRTATTTPKGFYTFILVHSKETRSHFHSNRLQLSE